jgi:hypothetical protein
MLLVGNVLPNYMKIFPTASFGICSEQHGMRNFRASSLNYFGGKMFVIQSYAKNSTS